MFVFTLLGVAPRFGRPQPVRVQVRFPFFLFSLFDSSRRGTIPPADVLLDVLLALSGRLLNECYHRIRAGSAVFAVDTTFWEI